MIISGRKFGFLVFTLLVVLFVFVTNFYYPLRSYLIMFPVSKYYQFTGLFREIPLHIPSGSLAGRGSFFPYVLYFNAGEGFARYLNLKEDIQLSIIYNFGNFSFGKKYAAYFDPQSDLYSAFYGAYAVNNKELFFTADGKIKIEKLTAVPAYDQKYLVMPAIGLAANDVTFEADSITIEEDVHYIELPGWGRIDAMLKTNTPAHRYRTRQIGYLQYGVPKGLKVKSDYQVELLAARVYCRYFAEYNATIVFYIMAKDRELVEEIDTVILSRSLLKKKKEY